MVDESAYEGGAEECAGLETQWTDPEKHDALCRNEPPRDILPCPPRDGWQGSKKRGQHRGKLANEPLCAVLQPTSSHSVGTQLLPLSSPKPHPVLHPLS